MRNKVEVKHVRLNEQGLMGKSQQVGLSYLLRMDADRLLAPLYEGSGKTAKRACYGGWESLEIKGHSVGHYLSALAVMYASTGDLRLKELMDYVVEEMASIQREDGYLAGFLSTPFDKAFTGEFEVENFSLNGYWVPWYSIHKVYAGLVDAYVLGENTTALEVVKKLADWVYEKSSAMTEEAFQKMLISEHGGMNEVMAQLYEITGDRRYLYLAERFTHHLIINPLMDGVDDLQGKHANTQIPKILGAAKLYEVTGDMRYQKAALFFFDQVVEGRTFVIGGNSIGEHFGASGKEELGKDTAETCNTYNMMKLALYLFNWTKDVKYMDYYERALYNHILASQEPVTGAKTYFVSTYPGHFKVYGTDENAFWCCTGTGMENPGRYNIGIYERDSDHIYINLFIASTLQLADKGIIIEQQTTFPEADSICIHFKEARGERLSLKIRVPYWVTGEVAIEVGSRVYKQSENGYITIENNWQVGDSLCIKLPMGIHQYIAKDDPHKIALLYGPLVLAGALGREDFPDTDIVDNQLALMNWPTPLVATLVTNSGHAKEWLLHKQGLTFETLPIGQPGKQIIQLKPFYEIHHERYTIYFTKVTPEYYNKVMPLYKEETQLHVVDEVQPGHQQSEIEHQFKGQNATMGYSHLLESSWREACGEEGLISYVLQVQENRDHIVEVHYSKASQPGQNDFKVEIEGHILGEENLSGYEEEERLCRTYTLSKQLLAQTSGEVTIRFTGKGPTSIIGKILSIKVIRSV